MLQPMALDRMLMALHFACYFVSFRLFIELAKSQFAALSTPADISDSVLNGSSAS